jgi:hypothetical protein
MVIERLLLGEHRRLRRQTFAPMVVAGITRSDLFTTDRTRRAIRFYDLRARTDVDGGQA